MSPTLLIGEKYQDIAHALELLLEDWWVVTVAPDFHVIDTMAKPVVQLIVNLEPQSAASVTNALVDQWQEAADRFVVFSPTSAVTVQPSAAEEERKRHALQWAALEQVQAKALCPTADGLALMYRLRSAAKASLLPSWAVARLERTISARRLHRVLAHFSHGKQRDLSNQFLAPARLLHLSGDTHIRPEWNSLWSEFTSVDAVSPQVLARCGALGLEFGSAMQAVGQWLNSGARPDGVVPHLDRLMALMTEARVAAGERSTGETGIEAVGSKLEAVETTAGSGDDLPPDYLILVVDDHAAAWRPVFSRLRECLDTLGARRLRFEFSEDGETTRRSARNVPIPWGDYDLVVLDVFLGSGRDGRKILERIRRSFAHLPILLWTTSRDEELTSHASRANGILLKKLISWEDLLRTVDSSLPEGRAKRISLPSAFFNHTLRDEDQRRLVWDCTDWCLKQLDSFHALDGGYFRYFTDHGGRHIIKLLELLAQALRPFLEDPEEKVLPSHGDQREFELLSLYLGVVFHELGMFPMRLGPKLVERFAELTSDYLDDVRSLHAVRGMALLCDAEYRFWSDDEGKSLGWRMGVAPESVELLSAGGAGPPPPWAHPGNPSSTLRDSVAALVGYHARFFESLEADKFLEWSPSGRLKKLRSPVATLSRADDEFKSALSHLQERIPKGKPVRERLRRQCALFRFVDALDIAGSRNPAVFLIHNRERSADNNREYLKRQICREVTIRAGKVVVQTCALQPKPALVRRIVADVDRFQLGRREGVTQPGFAGPAGGGALSDEWTRDPWRVLRELPEVMQGQRKERSRLSIVVVQSLLDDWLTAAWRVVQSADTSDSFAQELKSEDLNVLEPNSVAPRLTLEGKKLMASISALSVAGEVISEYEAVVDAGLEERIGLEGFRWAEAEDLASWETEPPTVLTMLREGLLQYAGVGRS